jgi:hypothetical protein
MTVDKNTILGTSALKNIMYNSATQSTSGTTLSALPSLFVFNVVDFTTLSSNTVTFEFTLTQIHQKLIVRARALTECDSANSQNATLQMALSGTPNAVVNPSLTTNLETIVEAEVVHSAMTFSVTIQFGTQGQTCRRLLQDFSIFYEKCETYCASNDCPDVKPYFKHPSQNKCVADCPDGYTESGTICVSTELCHSTCDTCSIKNDATKCSTCSSTLSSLPYDSLTLAGSCVLPPTNNAQFLMTVDKNTILGTSALKNITYNSTTSSTSDTALSALPSLFVFNVVDFSALSSNTVTFEFTLAQIHQKLIVRARVLTECDSENSQNTTLQMTLSGTSNVVVNPSLTTNLETIVEAEVVHSASTFSVMIQFGTQGQTCRRLLQDFSIFYEKCETYCASNDCPDVKPYFKHPSQNKCVPLTDLPLQLAVNCTSFTNYTF